ncbi:MAG TPA: lysophospholipid acyltransferase family protein [Bacilli bacterium]|mgnify:FL=1|nr:lysophospholipid acyltransferase family protein [Bacilli bacterium]HOQ70383.1 lysophospholipid acyltransferase family protein [Bacilli bacterium]
MIKYIIWIVKVAIPLMWGYFTWMRPYARRPDKYPPELRMAKGQKLARRVLRILKVDVEIRNMPDFKRDEIYYIVSNHTSVLDLVVLLAYLPIPVSFLSKVENKKIPFVRTLMRVYKGLYLERNNLRQEIKVMQMTRDSLANKEVSWLIFPEGTRSKDYHGNLSDYKAGAFKAPLATNTTIVPVVMWGNQMVLPLRTRARRYKVIVEFLPLLKPEGTTLELANKIYEASNATASKLREEYGSVQKINKYGRKIMTLQLSENIKTSK